MNWNILIPIGLLLVLLVAVLIAKNQKDKRELERQLNEDYTKPKKEENDTDTEEPMK